MHYRADPSPASNSYESSREYRNDREFQMKISMNIIKTVGVGIKNFKMALKTVCEKVKKLQFLCQQNIFLHKQHTVEAEKRLALNHFCFRI